ncbi:gustatory receptor 10a-like [Musca vetustissima]|uniref:gustatory receptor 10a-like n=1 Tax=Musca vetustissima TaxID=27455 RepID=UPI002AB763F5|nr:gustatory receptor 10a-like [Musca vetustissima]
MSSEISFWEKYKDKIYIFGHVYANLYGLVVINYIPTIPTKSFKHYLAVVYSHVVSFVVILILPLYFVYSIHDLVETKDRRWQLQLVVNFSNTLIKYCMVVITYIANFVHYKDIRQITQHRQWLEDEFNRSSVGMDEVPRKRFEFMLLFKFGLINAMMLVQVAQILNEYFLGGHPVRVYFQIYTFFLWNYTENMADYFYFINCSALKFYRQLHQKLQQMVEENRSFVVYCRRRKRAGLLGQLCCVLSDRLQEFGKCYWQIYDLYKDSIRLHQFQILGLIFTTLISNLTNLFTLFNLLFKHHSEYNTLTGIFLHFIFAIIFYIDTYIVTMISDQIENEVKAIKKTLKEFAEIPGLDWRLEETLENLSLALITFDGRFRICGLFYLDRHLTFLTAATGLSYFITLVQFDINWNNLK